MNNREKQDFAEKFVGVYLSQGFGSLPKSEIDLLVFHLLTQTRDYKGKSNYDLSTLFKVTQSRIKSFRINSALKYEEIDSKAILSRIVERLTNSEQFAEFSGGKVELSLEDPVEKRELENFLKIRGYHAEYNLNTEVLKISTVRLFELIVENLENPNDRFNEIVQANIEDAEVARELAEDALTLGQKFTRLRRETFSVDTMRALIGAAAGAL